MSYKLIAQKDSIEQITVDEKLYTVGGDSFEATPEQLENIEKWFVVEEVKEDEDKSTVENKEVPEVPAPENGLSEKAPTSLPVEDKEEVKAPQKPNGK